jgi:tRNA 2-thiouridine synthesizing protein B
MLHLIFQSPIEIATLQRMDTGDVVVFFENAVFRLLKSSAVAQVVSEKLHGMRLCVLADDLAVRGITADELIIGLDIIDYAELVNLTVLNTPVQSWT